MADERLRRAERALQAGDPEAEARLLVERVRAGTLTPERLRLLAWLEHPAARRAEPDAPRAPDLAEVWAQGLPRWRRYTPGLARRQAEQAWLAAWCAGVGRDDLQPLVRGGLCVARRTAARLGPQGAEPVLLAVEAWLRDPGPAAAEACLRAADAQVQRRQSTGGVPRLLAGEIAALVAYATGAIVAAAAADGLARALTLAAHALRGEEEPPPGPEAREDWSPPAALRPPLPELVELVRGELVAAALG